ncbi:hypothetical protein ACIPIN_14650 [Pseudomonas sp. NPDC087697]|uniref:hypothetical protein n=1 Tax=Pseudomonas sp. NPDC087697 TaxID=3364447 RepID=UPI0037F67D70
MKLCLAPLVLMLAPIISWADGSNTPPSLVRAALDSCGFTMTDFYGGTYEIVKEGDPHLFFYSKLINPKAKKALSVNITFRCVNPATPEDFFKFSGSKLTDKGWVMDLDPDVANDSGMHNTFYLLKGKGWEGTGISQDVTNGDEENRTRRFGFCIPHDGAALCGGGDVAYLNDLKSSSLKQVVKMLETIEFIEPSTGAPMQK